MARSAAVTNLCALCDGWHHRVPLPDIHTGCGGKDKKRRLSRYYTGGLTSVRAVASNDVWAIGQVLPAPHGGSIDNFYHWDGNRWQLIPLSHPGRIVDLVALGVAGANDIWAVGSKEGRNTPTTPMIEHWKGSTWSEVTTPMLTTNSSLNAVAVVSANDVWAVGQQYASGITSTLVEHWDGATWSIVPSPDPSQFTNAFWGAAPIPGTNQVWAVGSDQTMFTTTTSLGALFQCR